MGECGGVGVQLEKREMSNSRVVVVGMLIFRNAIHSVHDLLPMINNLSMRSYNNSQCDD